MEIATGFEKQREKVMHLEKQTHLLRQMEIPTLIETETGLLRQKGKVMHWDFERQKLKCSCLPKLRRLVTKKQTV